MSHLLVTNDFPPKLGGIQSYLWELWRRLDPDRVTVLTTPHPGAAEWDAAQAFRIVRTRQRVLLPTPGLLRQINALAAEVGATFVMLDPALPLGYLARGLDLPYGLVVHGSEVLGRLPLAGAAMGRVIAGSRHVIAAGNYPAGECRRLAGARTPPITVIPPGVDVDRFRPLDDAARRAARAAFGLPEGPLVVGVSRLVPRKGFDVLIDAVAQLQAEGAVPGLTLAIAGGGRDHDRLAKRIASTGAPARLLGRVPDADLPALYGAADVFAMVCRGNRWFGIEQEGFGIVYLEAAACGVAQIAGASGGTADAVEDGVTGIVVGNPRDAGEVAGAIGQLLEDGGRRARMAAASRTRAERDFTYETLAARLDAVLGSLEAAR